MPPAKVCLTKHFYDAQIYTRSTGMIDNTQTQSREDHEERDLMFGEIDKRNRVN